MPAPGIGPVWAEGGLWSSAEDMARWILFQLGGYGGDPDGDSGAAVVLDPASLREMHRPRYLADDSWSRAWGISWCGFRKDDHVWIQHGGGLPGFTSILCFDPARRVGAVVLVNGTAPGLDIGYELAAIARAAMPEPRLSGAVSAAPPAGYLPLLGVYSRPHLGGWVIRLEWQAGDLVFVSPEAPGWKLALLPTADPDVFTVEPGSNLAGEDVVFRRLADGRVGSVLLVETSYARLDPAVGSER